MKLLPIILLAVTCLLATGLPCPPNVPEPFQPSRQRTHGTTVRVECLGGGAWTCWMLSDGETLVAITHVGDLGGALASEAMANVEERAGGTEAVIQVSSDGQTVDVKDPATSVEDEEKTATALETTIIFACVNAAVIPFMTCGVSLFWMFMWRRARQMQTDAREGTEVDAREGTEVDAREGTEVDAPEGKVGSAKDREVDHVW